MIQYFEKMTLSTSASLDANLINVDFESNELFLVQDIESIINTLANKIFAHRLISKNDITINDITVEFTFYSYITSSESRYDDREFKGLLIDSDTTRKSIEEMKQFKTLQRINNVKLDKSDRLVFKFEIENTKSVDSIKLETLTENDHFLYNRD
jgi:hypothetical protein